MSREASAALAHLANLLVARAELRLDLDAVAHPSPGVSVLASFEDAVAKAEQRWLAAWQQTQGAEQW